MAKDPREQYETEAATIQERKPGPPSGARVSVIKTICGLGINGRWLTR